MLDINNTCFFMLFKMNNNKVLEEETSKLRIGLKKFTTTEMQKPGKLKRQKERRI